MRIPVSRSVSFSEVRQSLRKGLSSSSLALVLRTSFGQRRTSARWNGKRSQRRELALLVRPVSGS